MNDNILRNIIIKTYKLRMMRIAFINKFKNLKK